MSLVSRLGIPSRLDGLQVHCEIMGRDNVHKKVANAANIHDIFSREGKAFTSKWYKNWRFLDAYLIWYFSQNVPKIQLVLLDLLRRNRLGPNLIVLDVGVGTGTTAIAVLDFLLIWGCACQVHGEPFPITNLQFTGVDRDRIVLNYASSVLTSYTSVLSKRTALKYRESRMVSDESHSRISALLAQVCGWAKDFAWYEHDLSDGPPHKGEANLIVASNILNELDDSIRGSFERLINGLQKDELAIIIEPGAEKDTMGLMEWRRGFLTKAVHHHLTTVAPCGQGFDDNWPDLCNQCWNRRVEAFDEPELYRCFAEKCEENPRTRDKKNQIAWSYVVIGHRGQRSRSTRLLAQRLFDTKSDSYETYELRYIGSTTKSRYNGRFAKICPELETCRSADLAIAVDHGLSAPEGLRYGDRIVVSRYRFTDSSSASKLDPLPGATISRIDPRIEELMYRLEECASVCPSESVIGEMFTMLRDENRIVREYVMTSFQNLLDVVPDHLGALVFRLRWMLEPNVSHKLDTEDRQVRDLARVLETLEPDHGNSVLTHVTRTFHEMSAAEMKRWFQIVPPDRHMVAPPEVSLHVLACAPGQGLTEDAVFSLREMATPLLANSEFAERVHERLLVICSEHPDQLAEYIQDCLEANPPRTVNAADAFDRLLSIGDWENIQIVLRWVGTTPELPYSARLTEASEFFRLVEQWNTEREHGSALDSPDDFESFRRIFNFMYEEERSDMVVAIIQAMGNELKLPRCSAVWFEAEALCDARRLDVAEAILAHPNSGLKESERVDLTDWIRELRREGKCRAAPPNAKDYERILHLWFPGNSHQ